MFIKFIDIDWLFFCIILALVCSLRACHMWLTRNHMFIREIWGKFTSFIFWNFEMSLVSLERFQNFKKVNSVNLSQIYLLNMWLLVLIWKNFKKIFTKNAFSLLIFCIVVSCYLTVVFLRSTPQTLILIPKNGISVCFKNRLAFEVKLKATGMIFQKIIDLQIKNLR